MGTSFIPLCAIIANLIIAFLFASLPQVSHKIRCRVLYVIAIIMLVTVIPISKYMIGDTKISVCTFAEYGLIITPSITFQPKDICNQQEFMHFNYSTFLKWTK